MARQARLFDRLSVFAETNVSVGHWRGLGQTGASGLKSCGLARSQSILFAGQVLKVRTLAQAQLSRPFTFERCLKRTPGPPPFSSMNTTPALSNARLMTSRVARLGWLVPASNW